MPQSYSGAPAEGIQRAHLIGNQILHLCWRQVHISASKALQIRESGVGSYGYAAFSAQPGRLCHGIEIARMEAAGHIRRGDQGNDLLIHSQMIRTVAFAKVAVQINCIHTHQSFSREFFTSVMNICPGAWEMAMGGLALMTTDWGVTPQHQNTGISPS